MQLGIEDQTKSGQEPLVGKKHGLKGSTNPEQSSATSVVQTTTTTSATEVQIDGYHAKPETANIQPLKKENDVTSVSPKLLQRLLESYATLCRRRERYLLLRSQITNERSTYLHSRRFLEESILGHAEEVSQPELEGLESASGDAFRYAHLADDRKTLEAQSTLLRQIESQEDSTQFGVAEADEQFMAALKQVIVSMADGAELWRGMEMAAEENVRVPSETSNEIPEPAQTYFDAAGDSYILQEQLAELQHQYLDDREMREFLRDQQTEPRTPDSAFEHRYHSAQMALYQRLDEAVRVAEEARKVCEENGVDIEAFRRRNRSESNGSKGAQTPRASSALFADAPDERLLRADELVSDEATSDERVDGSGLVQDWLETSAPDERPDFNRTTKDLPKERLISRRAQNRRDNRPALRQYRSESDLDVGV